MSEQGLTAAEVASQIQRDLSANGVSVSPSVRIKHILPHVQAAMQSAQGQQVGDGVLREATKRLIHAIKNCDHSSPEGVHYLYNFIDAVEDALAAAPSQVTPEVPSAQTREGGDVQVGDFVMWDGKYAGKVHHIVPEGMLAVIVPERINGKDFFYIGVEDVTKLFAAQPAPSVSEVPSDVVELVEKINADCWEWRREPDPGKYFNTDRAAAIIQSHTQAKVAEALATTAPADAGEVV